MFETPILPIDTGRYGSEEMRRIFDEEAKLQRFLDVEAAVAKAQAALGVIPKSAAEEIGSKASTKFVRLARCKEIESEIGHDLMALVRALTEQCKGEGGKWVHYGLTSYDVEDTATALQFKDALQILEKDLVELEKALLTLTRKHAKTVMVGRTHGQHMGVITFGLKTAVWMREVARHLQRLRELRGRVLAGKILGAVGTGAGLGKEALKIQEQALGYLGLKPADMVTQIVQRDVHAELIAYVSLVASTMDKIAVEVRNLQRTEIQEVMEPFEEERQVGSSAMPAKRNPVLSERASSLARLLRSLVIPALENVPLWHERDLTNSANERFLFPMSFILIDQILKDMKRVLQGLEVYPENMRRNLEMTAGLILSERVTTRLVEKGIGRQEAHEIVRQCSMKALTERVSFEDALLERQEVSKLLTSKELKECLDYSSYLGVTDQLIEKAIATTTKELG